ncbi:AraC family transcriptional regulator [Agrobacterium rhizogenes]|uniref:helix-turn-helix transcriptional regulator n=1 Tax=Rhizobium rhizogenes TaxID=359 RepID=UPI0022B6D30F|nr:AraC family transcriptional regulator [Rhizobium rhizogenes]MCZ7451301.1 AraC family transcriptional regulator [Rhizobium rhizogenes]
MPQNSSMAFEPSFEGSTFEEMVQTFTEQFGPFDASPIGSATSFTWRADYRTDGKLTLLSSQFHNEWRLKAAPEQPEWLSILLPRTGAIAVSVGHRIVESHPGNLVLVNNHQVDQFAVRGEPHISDILRLDWSVIRQTVTAIFETPLNGPLDLSPVVDLTVPAGQLIGNMCRTIVGGLQSNGPLLQSPIAMSHITLALADVLIRTIPNRYSRHLEKRTYLIAPWHVRDAMDFMQANVAKPITMSMVAEAVGVSVRALETGFRTFRETTPAAYLRSLRLSAVRNDLLDPSNLESVGAICLKQGFFHFGRFSAAYRATYGENPSETRRRSIRV